MTPEAVDLALDDVRPYLIADGGNVEVVAVEGGRVFLQLQVRGRPGGAGGLSSATELGLLGNRAGGSGGGQGAWGAEQRHGGRTAWRGMQQPPR